MGISLIIYRVISFSYILNIRGMKMTKYNYDVVVVGTGNATLSAREGGLKVLMVEKGRNINAEATRSSPAVQSARPILIKKV